MIRLRIKTNTYSVKIYRTYLPWLDKTRDLIQHVDISRDRVYILAEQRLPGARLLHNGIPNVR